MSDILKEQEQLGQLDIPGDNPAAADNAGGTKKPETKKSEGTPKPSRSKNKQGAPKDTDAPVNIKKADDNAPDVTAKVLRKGPMVMLQIHESDTVPPDGVFVSINGHSYKIQAGAWVKVPRAVVSVLENAVEQKAILKEGNIVGYRNAPRYAFSTKEVA